MWPLHRALWTSAARRSRKLLEFSQVEAGGGRDLVRAAELTHDPRLRRLFLAHAREEDRHARLFRARGVALRAQLVGRGGRPLREGTGAEPGMDALRVEDEDTASLLAFIHLSECAAARDFATYRSVLDRDPETQALFARILRDEEGHMAYSLRELERIAGNRSRGVLWRSRLRRLWRAYLRLASGLANLFSTALLLLQYFILIPPFALAAKLSMAREKAGWVASEGASAKGERP